MYHWAYPRQRHFTRVLRNSLVNNTRSDILALNPRSVTPPRLAPRGTCHARTVLQLLSCVKRIGCDPIPFKFAEAFTLGRANLPGMADLAMSSLDGESGRPVSQGEGRGNPTGQTAGGSFLLGTFLWTSKEKYLAIRAKPKVERI